MSAVCRQSRWLGHCLPGSAAASKIDSFAIMPFIACGNAVSTYTAQNLGAGKSVSRRLRQACSVVAATCGNKFAMIMLLRA